jgi:hypothetical protein
VAYHVTSNLAVLCTISRLEIDQEPSEVQHQSKYYRNHSMATRRDPPIPMRWTLQPPLYATSEPQRRHHIIIHKYMSEFHG